MPKGVLFFAILAAARVGNARDCKNLLGVNKYYHLNRGIQGKAHPTLMQRFFRYHQIHWSDDMDAHALIVRYVSLWTDPSLLHDFEVRPRFREDFGILRQRLLLLEQFLASRPPENLDPNFTDTLYDFIFADWTEQRGFSTPYPGTQLVELYGEIDRLFHVRPAPSSHFSADGSLFLRVGEDEQTLRGELRRLRLDILTAARSAEPIGDFDGLDYVVQLSFYTLHNTRESGAELLPAFARGLTFIHEEFVSPHTGAGNEMPGDRLFSFFLTLKQLLSGELQDRYGAAYIHYARAKLRPALSDLRFFQRNYNFPLYLSSNLETAVLAMDCYRYVGLEP